MTSGSKAFKPVIVDADGDAPSAARGAGFGRRPQGGETVADAGPPEAPSDSDLARRIKDAVGELQDAMDAAVRAGLIVEPEFRAANSRFGATAGPGDAYVCTVKVYRKLA